jgi:hypothetical protein
MRSGLRSAGFGVSDKNTPTAGASRRIFPYSSRSAARPSTDEIYSAKSTGVRKKPEQPTGSIKYIKGDLTKILTRAAGAK